MSKLEEMLKYVSEHNEFYKNRIKEYGISNPLDITQWPILTRKELQANRYNMFSDGYKSKYFNQQLRRQSSSGSSGIPVNVYWDYQEWYASNMALWRKRSKWYGVKPSDKRVIFTLHGFEKKYDKKSIYCLEYHNTLAINMSLVQNDYQLECVRKQIVDFSPTWIYIQPNILDRLIALDNQMELKTLCNLRYIETVGELLPQDLKRRAQNFFDVPLANMYGSEEMNGIAYESPYGEMKILEDNVFVEVCESGKLRKEGKGEAIITNLNNRAMPLIRYSQNDFITIDSSNMNNSTISRISGRVLDAIFIDNYQINSITLMEIISETNNIFNDPIAQYIFSYHNNSKKLVCRIKIKAEFENWESQIVKYIEYLFDRKVDAHQHLNFVVELLNEALCSTHDGKRAIILNE